MHEVCCVTRTKALHLKGAYGELPPLSFMMCVPETIRARLIGRVVCKEATSLRRDRTDHPALPTTRAVGTLPTVQVSACLL